jgi:hypothetical protein
MNDTSDFLIFEGQSGDNFVIPSIIQFLSLLNKTGKLDFYLSDDSSASMYMYDGNLTHTELNNLGGIDVISHMFCWNYGHGKFRFRSDYTGEKILYKSLGKLVPQQILMRVMQRNDECPYKKEIKEKFSKVTDIVSLNEDNILETDLNDSLKKKVIDYIKKKEKVTLSELLTNVFNEEIESCKVFHQLLLSSVVVNANNWDKSLEQKHLLEVMNIIAKYTDQNIALKFLADKRNEVGLSPNESITIRKLKKISLLAKKEFTKLLPQAENRWKELYHSLNEYINSIEV